MASTLGFSTEITTKVCPARMLEFAQDVHNHAAQSMPHMVSEAMNHQGDGRAGTITQFSLKEGLPFSHIKFHIDALDKESYEIKFTLLEGGNIGTKLASAVYCFKMTPKDDGGCVFKITGEFTPLPGVEFTEKDVEVEKKLYVSFFHAMEKHLLENPDAFA